MNSNSFGLWPPAFGMEWKCPETHRKDIEYLQPPTVSNQVIIFAFPKSGPRGILYLGVAYVCISLLILCCFNPRSFIASSNGLFMFGGCLYDWLLI